MPEKPKNRNIDKLILQDHIQKTYNRIQYDRTLEPDQKRGLEISLEEMENQFTLLFPEA